MQEVLTGLLCSFHTESGVPTVVYDATYRLITLMYSSVSASYFSNHVKSIDSFCYFRDGSPRPEDFIRKFGEIN